MAFGWQLLVEASALGFPGDHLIAYRFDDFAGIACHQATAGYLFPSLDERQGTNNTLLADISIIHHYGVHAHQAVGADDGPVDDGAVPDMRSGFKPYPQAGEHVQGTVFLHVAAVFDEHLPPVAADSCPRADVNLSTDDDVASDGCLGMDEGSGVYYGAETFEFVNHGAKFSAKIRPRC